jgi:hypothetical protein
MSKSLKRTTYVALFLVATAWIAAPRFGFVPAANAATYQLSDVVINTGTNTTTLAPTMSPNNTLEFNLVPGTGFSTSTTITYSVADDFAGTSITDSDIDQSSGLFSWPVQSQDIGTHNLTFKVSDTDNDSGTVVIPVIVYPDPVVSSVSPNTGSTLGGTDVTITGSGLTSANEVDFGSNPAPSFTVNSDTSVSAVSPSGTEGTVDVTVITGGGPSATSANDQYTYATTAPSSDDALSDLTVNGTTVTDFSTSTLTYNVSLPSGTTEIPVVGATTEDINATDTITQATELPGSATVLVTAADGETNQTYTINFTVAAPVPSSDDAISDLTVNGTTVSGFSTSTLTYNVALPSGTTEIPVVGATTEDSNATDTITQATALPGSATVAVTAADGVTNQTYTVNFTVLPTSDDNLSDLTVNGTTVSGFSADTLTYDVTLPVGTTDVPVVGATTEDSNANYTISQATGLPGSATVLVTAADGETNQTYTINFTVAPTESGGSSGGGGEVYYSITLNQSGTGTGSVTANGENCGTACWFSEGTSVTLSAFPSSGSNFGGWSGACTGSSLTCTSTLKSDQVVGAAFNSGSIVIITPVTSSTTTASSTPQSEVLGASTIQNGSLILEGSTVYLIENNQKLPFATSEEFFSYGFSFSQVLTNVDISSLAQGPIMKAMDDTLALDTSSNSGTVYMIGDNGVKRGFVSAQVFSSLGYSFSQVRPINLSGYQLGAVINSSTDNHPDGSLVSSSGTNWWIDNGQLHGFPNTSVFDSYNFSSSAVVTANSADLGLAQGSVVQTLSQELSANNEVIP